MCKHHPVLSRLFLISILCLLLCGCGSKAPESPEAYTLGENSAPSLDLYLGAAAGTLTQIDEPTEEDPDHYIYHYDQVLDAKGTVQLYYSQMILPEQGFTLVDQSLLPLENPDFDKLTGELILVRPAVEEGQLFRIIVAFTAEQVCTVDVSRIEGTIRTPAKEETPEPATLAEQVEHMYSYTPAQLGLEGADLHEYKVFPVEGVMSVDGRACRQFNVYQVDSPENNVSRIAGIYLLTLDLKNVYQLDTESGYAVLLQ